MDDRRLGAADLLYDEWLKPARGTGLRQLRLATSIPRHRVCVHYLEQPLLKIRSSIKMRLVGSNGVCEGYAINGVS